MIIEYHAFQLVISSFLGSATDCRFYNIERVTDYFFGNADGLFIYKDSSFRYGVTNCYSLYIVYRPVGVV